MTAPGSAPATLPMLVRRWAVDWLNAQHPQVCAQILAPEYTLLIGGDRKSVV